MNDFQKELKNTKQWLNAKKQENSELREHINRLHKIIQTLRQCLNELTSYSSLEKMINNRGGDEK
jgi:flagellin-specific chaperone FliS